MARVPITLMGYRCERCGHEWVPRGQGEEEPRVCPKCRSPWWNKPRKPAMPYEEFRDRIVAVLRAAGGPLTWTEVRTAAGLRQTFPNNQWVHRMESDVGLHRRRGSTGVIHWTLKTEPRVDLFADPTAEASDKSGQVARRKQGTLE